MAPARLRTPRVHDLPAIDVGASTPRPLQEPAHAHAPRHARSVSELPFDAAALASPQARARKRWGSPERPSAMFSAASAGDSHRDLSKGLRELLSFVHKGGGKSGGAGEQQPFPAPSPRGGGRRWRSPWSSVEGADGGDGGGADGGIPAVRYGLIMANRRNPFPRWQKSEARFR